MEKLISVIIPVYKVEQYLKRCIESVIHQSYTNLEIILVDDGSPDECPEICDRYMQRDSRIKVIHKKNGGLSSARNAGLEIATGEYVTFVDSDDYIDEKMIGILMGNLIDYDCDISVCFWEEVWEKEDIISLKLKKSNHEIEVLNQEQAMKKMLYQRNCDSCAWGKLYKRYLFDTIRFPEQKIYEDIAIMYQVFGIASQVVFSNYKGYFYLQRSTSISKVGFDEKKMSLIDFVEGNERYLGQHYPELIIAAKSRSVRANFHMYLQIPNEIKYQEFRRRIEKNIKERRLQVLLDRETSLGTKAALLMTYLGFGFILVCKKMKNLGKTM